MGIDEPPNGTRHDSSTFGLVLSSQVPSLFARLLDLQCDRLVSKGWNPPLARTSPQMHGLVLAEEL